MDFADLIIWGLPAVPAALALICLVLTAPRHVIALVTVAGPVWAALALAAAYGIHSAKEISTAGNWMYADTLSAYHVMVLALVFGAGSLYSHGYFHDELEHGHLSLEAARKFGALWFGSASAMVAVLLCNNLGLMWVGIETTTLLTAFLICVHVTPLSLEAMWKYLVVCSVGVAFAFVGTLLVAASARNLNLEAGQVLLWTNLNASTSLLDPAAMKLAFIFLLVGYGTKIGLAPLHSWLPDAHSQAPAPVSALFSGFMLNAAFYCLMRCLPLVEGAPGAAGWGREMLLVLGAVSVLVAAAFIVVQHDGKRFLAYSSVEHMGIVALGLGLGGVGVFAALWHTLNHAIGKSLSFFSIGRLGQMYGSHDLAGMAGAMRRSPIWGAGFFGGVLALIGVAPFAIFMSEFQVLRAALDARTTLAYISLGAFLLGAAVVFLGALRLVMIPAWGKEVAEPAKPARESAPDAVIVGGALTLLLVLGLWLPRPLHDAMQEAGKIIGGQTSAASKPAPAGPKSPAPAPAPSSSPTPVVTGGKP